MKVYIVILSALILMICMSFREYVCLQLQHQTFKALYNVISTNCGDSLSLQTENPMIIIDNHPYGEKSYINICKYTSSNKELHLDLGKTAYGSKLSIDVANNGTSKVNYDISKGTKRVKPFNINENTDQFSLVLDTCYLPQGRIKLELQFKVHFSVLSAGEYVEASHSIYGCCICYDNK